MYTAVLEQDSFVAPPTSGYWGPDLETASIDPFMAFPSPSPLSYSTPVTSNNTASIFLVPDSREVAMSTCECTVYGSV